MKQLAAAALLIASNASFAADTYTQGYVRKDGTYVQPHHSTAPNETRTDNDSSRPNVNPYTGQAGTVDPYSAPRQNHNSNPYGTQPRQRSNNGF